MSDPLEEERRALGAAQAALVAALVNHTPAPEGFDPARVRATAEQLERKRRGRHAR